MDAVRQEKIYTIENIYVLPDGERTELLDGKIYYMAPPTTEHQSLVKNFLYQIEDYMCRVCKSKLETHSMKIMQSLGSNVGVFAIYVEYLRVKSLYA